MVNADLVAPLSLPNGITIPNVPNIPGVGPGGLPNVPVPDFGGSNAYSLIVRVGQVTGTDQWEENRASGISPTCSLASGTTDWPFQPTFGAFQKTLDPNDADHLKDSDSSEQGGDQVNVAWDLTR